MRMEYARAGMVIASDILDDHGNLLLEQGIALTETYIARLKHMNIDTISIERPQLESAKPAPIISSELRLELTLCYQALLTMKTEGMLSTKLQTMYFRQLETVSDSVITQVEKAMPNIRNVEIRQLTPDEVSHAVNVCILSVITGLYLKLPRPALRELALGALLHDLGRSVIPLIDDKLADSPNMHPLYGRELLLKHKFSSTIARIAAEHHEYYDGSGFPLGLTGKAAHPLSRIVAIANYFDNALTQAATDGVPFREIIEDLLASSDILFDHNTLRAFIRITPIYTLGSMVVLSTGQTGYIIQNRVHYPLRPLVRVYAKTGTEDIDLANQPGIAILDVIQG